MPYSQLKKSYFATVNSNDNIFDLKRQSELEPFEKICQRVPFGQKWMDDTDFGFDKVKHFDRYPKFVNPEQCTGWVGVRPSLMKMGGNEDSALHYTDIQQGKLGDGWFLSALIAVTKHGLVETLFRRCDEEKGVYEFRFYRFEAGVGFQAVDVCVDRRVPILPGFDEYPCFCYSDDVGELWPTLIEKAFAKLIKSKKSKPDVYGFAAMDGGITSIALAHMTAGTSHMFDINPGSNPYEMFDDFNHRLNHEPKELMTILFRECDPPESVTGPLGFGKTFKGRNGLMAKQGYTVFGVYKIPTKTGQEVRLLEVRHPAGKAGSGSANLEWAGDWGDDSSMWSRFPEVAKAVGKTGKQFDDGVFFMSFEDASREACVFHACIPGYGIIGPANSRRRAAPASPTSASSAGFSRPGPYSTLSRSFFTNPSVDDGELVLKTQQELELFDRICERVPNGMRWTDDTDLGLQRIKNSSLVPRLIQPEQCTQWRGVTPSFLKVGAGEQEASHFSDVQQGRLGDGWFVSALAGITHRRLLNSIVRRRNEEKGVYEFRFYRFEQGRGFQPVDVCVDRRVPVAGQDDLPCFCYSDDQGELWPTLLEKAFAKVIKSKKAQYGVYGFAALEGGSSSIALAHMLSGPSFKYDVRPDANATEMYDDFARRDKNGELINVLFRETEPRETTTGPFSSGAAYVKGKKGLLANHSYTVLGTERTRTNDGRDLKFLVLRTPFGKAFSHLPLEWKGDWSDDSPLWGRYPEVARALRKLNNTSDGIFYMSFDDVAREVKAFHACNPSRNLPPPIQYIPPPPPVFVPGQIIVSDGWHSVKDFFNDPRAPPIIGIHSQAHLDIFDQIIQGPQTLWTDATEINIPQFAHDGLAPPQLKFPHHIFQWRNRAVSPFLCSSPPGTVSAGAFSASWFSSALQAVSLLGSNRLRQLIGRMDETRGAFEFIINRWVQGSGWQLAQVTVDCRIPISPNGSDPAYSRSDLEGELWPSLLEKAFVKAIEWNVDSMGRKIDGYANVSSIPYLADLPACVGLCHLLGGTARQYTMTTRPVPPQPLYQLLMNHIQAGHVMFIRFRESLETRQVGLIPNFSYCVLDLKTIVSMNVTLVQLRHPYGSAASQGNVWNGPWSMRSNLWRDNVELAHQCGQPDAVREFQFFMPLEEVAKFVDIIEICVLPPPPFPPRNTAVHSNPQEENQWLRAELQKERELRTTYEKVLEQTATNVVPVAAPRPSLVEYYSPVVEEIPSRLSLSSYPLQTTVISEPLPVTRRVPLARSYVVADTPLAPQLQVAPTIGSRTLTHGGYSVQYV